MRIALCSDEPYPVNTYVKRALEARGHELEMFGAMVDGKEARWAETAEAAALSVASGACQEGIFFCWSGTGICMAANKVPGVRAALCGDAQTAAAARTWNHANVLCLSNRSLSDDVAREILDAWLNTPPGSEGTEGVALLNALDRRHRR